MIQPKNWNKKSFTRIMNEAHDYKEYTGLTPLQASCQIVFNGVSYDKLVKYNPFLSQSIRLKMDAIHAGQNVHVTSSEAYKIITKKNSVFQLSFKDLVEHGNKELWKDASLQIKLLKEGYDVPIEEHVDELLNSMTMLPV